MNTFNVNLFPPFFLESCSWQYHILERKTNKVLSPNYLGPMRNDCSLNRLHINKK